MTITELVSNLKGLMDDCRISPDTLVMFGSDNATDSICLYDAENINAVTTLANNDDTIVLLTPNHFDLKRVAI